MMYQRLGGYPRQQLAPAGLRGVHETPCSSMVRSMRPLTGENSELTFDLAPFESFQIKQESYYMIWGYRSI